MEHTLRETYDGTTYPQCGVLILVLVEHTLGVLSQMHYVALVDVLILVLVEHTLGVIKNVGEATRVSLNPCFSGTYPRSL